MLKVVFVPVGVFPLHMADHIGPAELVLHLPAIFARKNRKFQMAKSTFKKRMLFVIQILLQVGVQFQAGKLVGDCSAAESAINHIAGTLPLIDQPHLGIALLK